MKAHSIEIPLVALNRGTSPAKLTKQEQKQTRSKSQNKSAFKNKLQFMKDIYEEA